MFGRRSARKPTDRSDWEDQSCHSPSVLSTLQFGRNETHHQASKDTHHNPWLSVRGGPELDADSEDAYRAEKTT
jgi:hypothetical protein